MRFEPSPTESGETARRQRSCRATPSRGEHPKDANNPLGDAINKKTHLAWVFPFIPPRGLEVNPRVRAEPDAVGRESAEAAKLPSDPLEG